VLLKTFRYLIREGPSATLTYGRHRVRNIYCRWLLKRKGVHIGRHVWFDGPVEIRMGIGGQLIIGDRCNFGKYVLLKVDSGARLELKENVKINRFCIIEAYLSVTLERDVLTGPSVFITDGNHNFLTRLPIKDADALMGPHHKSEQLVKPVVVSAYSWLGSGVRVLPGVTIGEHAVVGANAVVTREIPPFAIAAGVPCRILKFREMAEVKIEGEKSNDISAPAD